MDAGAMTGLMKHWLKIFASFEVAIRKTLWPLRRPDGIPVFETPVDVRNDFGPEFRPAYIRNSFLVNTARMEFKEIISSNTSLGRISQTIQEGAARLDSEDVSDAYGLLRATEDLFEFRDDLRRDRTLPTRRYLKLSFFFLKRSVLGTGISAMGAYIGHFESCMDSMLTEFNWLMYLLVRWMSDG
ncbi:uncharacterized protein N7483_007594 [Penicillium malachiteum]|uniref:uncharacterized protein n=1 Tax=Penicillium malachiteum TaxID=1324776 RepID=UPI0025473B80|nr:uncharacterized protein N7483_007594 [Penicillium malachiteum]KAJ5726237.1 hypothetical protein N7483_007594 [Penicillium malachiteum]